MGGARPQPLSSIPASPYFALHDTRTTELARLCRSLPDNRLIHPTGVADLPYTRCQRYFTGYVQRIHRRRGAVAGLRCGDWVLAHQHRQCHHIGIGGCHLGDALNLRKQAQAGSEGLSRQAPTHIGGKQLPHSTGVSYMSCIGPQIGLSSTTGRICCNQSRIKTQRR